MAFLLRDLSYSKTSGLPKVLGVAAIFFILILVFSLHRYYSFYASYDQGLFNQLFWNSIHGHLFQGSLSSGQSSAVSFDGQVHTVSYYHLGQHFVPDFLLWLPIYKLFPFGATLVVLQVVLITAAGLVLYALARHYLQPSIAHMIAASFYGAYAVIGPTFGNFYEHCQIPLFVFSLLLALEKRIWWLFWLFFALTLGIREDTGIILFGIGVYLALGRRYVQLGLALCLLSFSYVVLVTNVIMPLFSTDNSRLYLATFFSQYVGGKEPTTLELLWGILTHPKELIGSILTPFDKRVFYLLGQWLPLAFVPAVSPPAWIMSSFPLLELFLQQKRQSALAITIRYALSVVPSLFYGAILWWSQHSGRFNRRFRQFWIGCIALSIVLATVSNHNRPFYFLFPDSYRPWVYVSLNRQWEHVQHIRSLMSLIQPDASVSATTYLLPQLSSRRAIVRLPALKIQNDRSEVVDIDYALADLWQLQQYQAAFKGDRQLLHQQLIPLIDRIVGQGDYGIQDVQDGVVLLQKGVPSKPQAMSSWLQLRVVLNNT